MKFKVFLFLISLTLLNINLFANNNKNILIINSYHRGFQWSDDVLNGIESVLDHKEVNSTVLYMDSKRITSSKYYKKLKDLYKLQLSKNKYDLIVAIDKFSYEFILQNYNELFTHEPVYFIGLEQFSQDEVKKYNLEKKISGLLEKRAISDNLEILYKLIPNLKKLYIINDKSENGDDSDPFIQNEIYNLNDKFEVQYIRSSTLDDLKEKFSTYTPNEAVLFIRFYNDKNGKLYTYNEISQMIDSSKIPVFSTDTLFIKKGSTGGKLVPVKELGIKAGKDILAILNKNRELDIISGRTSYGVHKDDYVLLFDGLNSFDYCSLGQQKMSFLSLIFAYIELFRYKFNSNPIVLIDDVSGELDKKRWGSLIEYLKSRQFQVFITTANENFKTELEKLHNSKNILVSEGQISPQ